MSTLLMRSSVIIDVEASRAIRQAEVGAAKTMIGRTEERFGLADVARCAIWDLPYTRQGEFFPFKRRREGTSVRCRL